LDGAKRRDEPWSPRSSKSIEDTPFVHCPKAEVAIAIAAAVIVAFSGCIGFVVTCGNAAERQR
jgi:hypothetical protein